jgi:hypothetical protein
LHERVSRSESLRSTDRSIHQLDSSTSAATARALQAIKPKDPKIKEQLKAAGIQVDW